MSSGSFRPDARLLLPLAALYSLLIWAAAPPAPAACIALMGLFRLGVGRPLLPAGGFARALRFALFWAVLKLAVDAVLINSGSLSLVPVETLPELALQAGLLGLRLFLLLLLGLGLTGLVSAPAMGSALVWFIPPPLRGRLWRLGPALAFMARCLPEIFAAARDVRLAARSRGLPDKGPAFWKLALPQLFRLPALRVQALASAAAVRGLEGPETWAPPLARNGYALLFAFFAAGSAVAGLSVI